LHYAKTWSKQEWRETLLRARCRCAQCQAGRPSQNRCRRLHSPRTVPCRPGRWASPCCSAATARACTASAQAPRVSASAGDHTPLLVDHNRLRHLRGLCGKPCGRSYAQARHMLKWCGQQRCAVRYRASPDTLILTTLGPDCAWLQQTLAKSGKHVRNAVLRTEKQERRQWHTCDGSSAEPKSVTPFRPSLMLASVEPLDGLACAAKDAPRGCARACIRPPACAQAVLLSGWLRLPACLASAELVYCGCVLITHLNLGHVPAIRRCRDTLKVHD